MAKRTTSEDRARGATLTIRITHKTKYLMELLARDQRRSVTSVVEWLVDECAAQTLTWEKRGVKPEGGADRPLVDYLWDPDEHQRRARLGKYAPSLLTFEEELAYRIAHDDPAPWMNGFLESLAQQPEEEKRMTVEEFAELIKARNQAVDPPTSTQK